MYSKTKLERVLELHRGYDLPERERKEGNVPIISSSGYSGLHNDCKCDGENVITGRYGTIGEVFYHEGKCWPLNTALYVSDFKENNPKYVYYLLKYILKMSIDGKDKSTVPGVDRNVLHQMEIPFCQDIKEQKELRRILEKLDERIDLNRKINDNLVAVGTASIQKNVGRGALINLTEAEMDSLIFPEDFKIKTVSEFCAETKSGSTPSRTNNEYWENGTISWVKSGEVHNNITLQTEEYITSLGLSESSTKLLPKDTVLMAMYGVTAGEVGYLAIEATTNQAICGMICRSKAEAAYLYFSLIQSQAAISRLSNGGAQDNLSKNFIDNIKIVVPPSEFIEKLNLAAIVEQMTLNTKEITLLEELQATVLAQLSSR